MQVFYFTQLRPAFESFSERAASDLLVLPDTGVKTYMFARINAKFASN